MNKIDAYQEKYSIGNTKEYIRTLLTHTHVDFHPTIMEGHQLTLSESAIKRFHYKDKNWMANTMNGNIIGLFRDYYPRLMKVDKHKRAFLELAPDVRVYFKKMNEDYTPNNIRTDHVEDLWSQNLGDRGSKTHVIYMGYILNQKDWVILQGIYASYPNNFFSRKIDWVIDMADYVKSIRLTPVEKVNQQTDEIIISPKRKHEKTGE